MKKTMFLMCMAMLVFAFSANAQNAITIGNVTAQAGTKVMLPISFTNEKLLSGFEMHLTLPEGVEVEANNQTERSEGLIVVYCNYDEGVYKYSSTPIGMSPITGNDGVLMNITLSIGKAVAPEVYTVIISKAMFFAEDGDEIAVEDATATLTVEEAEPEVVVEDYQFYAKDVVVNNSNLATVDVRFNAPSDVSAYSCDIILPSGVKVYYNEDEDYDDWQIDLNEELGVSSNFTRNADYDESTNIISLTSKSKKSATYPEGDEIHLTMVLDVSEAASGFHPIAFRNQSVSSYGTNYYATDFVSTLKVVGTESLTLNINESGWGTLCLPFGAELPSGLKAYKATGVTDGYVVLEELSAIMASTPLVINGAPGTYIFSGDNSAAKRSKNKDGIMFGTLVANDFSEGYVMQTQSSGTGFFKLNGTINVPAYRCILVPEANSNARRYMLGRETTGISNIILPDGGDLIYTIDGRKVRLLVRGNAYIINGTKVLIK